MSVDLYVDGTLLRERADAYALAVALLALRSREDAELELTGETESLVVEKNGRGLHVSLLDDEGGEHTISVVGWDDAVEAVAEFMAGLPGCPGGLLERLNQAVKEERL